MANDQSRSEEHEELLAKNEHLVTVYYRLATLILVIGLAAHVLFAADYLVKYPAKDLPQALQFVTFNATALIVEIFLSRMAFMLGSRAGQLRDLRFAILLGPVMVDSVQLESAARIVMLLRRDASTTKVLDVESVASSLSSK
jgi:hypothetical protein